MNYLMAYLCIECGGRPIFTVDKIIDVQVTGPVNNSMRQAVLRGMLLDYADETAAAVTLSEIIGRGILVTIKFTISARG